MPLVFAVPLLLCGLLIHAVASGRRVDGLEQRRPASRSLVVSTTAVCSLTAVALIVSVLLLRL